MHFTVQRTIIIFYRNRNSMSNRCVCGKCVAMPTVRESICCCEIERVELKMNESENSVCCITEHEGFSSVCLNVWVLQTAYCSYRYHYGDAEQRNIHE